MSFKSTLVAAGLIVLPLFCFAASAPDKSAYSLFNRTPESQLRELSTDRPDLTESPYTMDTGWWQLESDLVAYTSDHDKSGGADVKASVLSIAAINLKVGLTSNIDLQTVFETHTHRIRRGFFMGRSAVRYCA